jgi:hypothetical protein
VLVKFNCSFIGRLSRDGSVGIATRLRSGRPRSRISIPGKRKRVLSLLHSVQTGRGNHPASYPMAAGVKRPGREAEHSLPSSAEIKNGEAIRPLPPMFSWSSS